MEIRIVIVGRVGEEELDTEMAAIMMTLRQLFKDSL